MPRAQENKYHNLLLLDLYPGILNHFRWYDSGDVQDIGDLEKISAIATAVPFVQFWLPTQEQLQEFQSFLNKSL